MLNLAANQIRSELDVVNLVRKLQEFDKLKQILLTEDQRKVFDNLPKPLVLYDKHLDYQQNKAKQASQMIGNYQRTYYGQKKEARMAAQRIWNQQKLSKIEQRLLELYNPPNTMDQ